MLLWLRRQWDEWRCVIDMCDMFQDINRVMMNDGTRRRTGQADDYCFAFRIGESQPSMSPGFASVMDGLKLSL